MAQLSTLYPPGILIINMLMFCFQVFAMIIVTSFEVFLFQKLGSNVILSFKMVGFFEREREVKDI